MTSNRIKQNGWRGYIVTSGAPIAEDDLMDALAAEMGERQWDVQPRLAHAIHTWDVEASERIRGGVRFAKRRAEAIRSRLAELVDDDIEVTPLWVSRNKQWPSRYEMFGDRGFYWIWILFISVASLLTPARIFARFRVAHRRRRAQLNPGWSRDKVRAPSARKSNDIDGCGVLIGHPDNGYMVHPSTHPGLAPLFAAEPVAGAQLVGRFVRGQSPREYDRTTRIRDELGRDLVDRDGNELARDAHHGLATASIIVGEVTSPGFEGITGIAPAADLVPIRVSYRRSSPVPSPVLFADGTLRLASGIVHAVDVGCDVISISVGGRPSLRLHKAVRYAVNNDVIVVCAGGNYLNRSIWPALYPEVIAVLGTDFDDSPWLSGSPCENAAVAAPAAHVWHAKIGAESFGRADGTSFSAAIVAGAAALWIQHHGREQLTEHYGGGLYQWAFRTLLETSGDPPMSGTGATVPRLNIEALISSPLPTRRSVESLRATQLSRPQSLR